MGDTLLQNQEDQKPILREYFVLDYDRKSILEQLNTNPNGDLILSGLFQQAGIKNQNGRIYPYNILDREVQKFQSVIQDGRAYGALDHPDCFTDQVKVLTAKNGWKYIKDISIGEEILSLNIKTKEIEIKRVTKVIYEDYSGEMISLKERNFRTKVTPNHRFLIIENGEYKYVTAETVFEKKDKRMHWSIPKIGDWSGVDCDKMIFPGIKKEELKEKNKYSRNEFKYTDAELDKFSKDLVVDYEVYCGLVGLYLSEGTNDPGKTLYISQSDKDSYSQNKVKEFFNNLPEEIKWDKHGDHYYRIKDSRIGYYFNNEEFGHNVYDKKIPTFIKKYSKKILERLFYWFNVGDGRKFVNEKGELIEKDVFSVSEKLIDDLHEIYIKCGKSGNRKIQIADKDYIMHDHLIEAKNRKPLHILNCSKTKNVSFNLRNLDIQKENYNGKISCLQVEDNHNFYVMDDRTTFWTGNSSIIEIDNACHLIKELKWDGNNLFGKTLILNTSKGKNLKEALRGGGKVGTSSRSFGSTKAVDDSTEVVNEDLQLITWDIVASPSVEKAILSEGLKPKMKMTIEKKQNKFWAVNIALDNVLKKY